MLAYGNHCCYIVDGVLVLSHLGTLTDFLYIFDLIAVVLAKDFGFELTLCYIFAGAS